MFLQFSTVCFQIIMSIYLFIYLQKWDFLLYDVFVCIKISQRKWCNRKTHIHMLRNAEACQNTLLYIDDFVSIKSALVFVLSKGFEFNSCW